MVREGPAEPAPRPAEKAYPTEKARGATINLRKPWQRMVFIIGLAAPIVLLLVLVLAGY
jgi:hypothetical protein